MSAHLWTPTTFGDYSHLDGLGHIISGITIDPNYAEGDWGIGLFTLIDNESSIKNLKLKGNLENRSGSRMGVLVGTIWNSTISNITNYAKVFNTSLPNGYAVGGIIGVMHGGTVEDCVNFAFVQRVGDSGQDQLACGGIIGVAEDAVLPNRIINCKNYGYVRANNSARVGGIVGVVYGDGGDEISRCINYGEVIGFKQIGGIVGRVMTNPFVKLKDCLNYGTITGWRGSDYLYIGGIAGQDGEFENCTNYGTISSRGLKAGGIVGSSGGKINFCTNYGEIYAPGQMGGIVGQASGMITNCRVIGNFNHVESNMSSVIGGGIAGLQYFGATVENCYFRGSVFLNKTSTSSVWYDLVGPLEVSSSNVTTTLKNTFADYKIINIGAVVTPVKNYTAYSPTNYPNQAVVVDSCFVLRYKYRLSQTECWPEYIYSNGAFNDFAQSDDLNFSLPFPKSLFAIGSQFVGGNILKYFQENNYTRQDV